ncbi:ArgS-related anticodon-binding protein NrtL [Streptomyces sp. M41]|uniref:ArgS-related anticodon-binding protein NrtL n=1 Tax=Streptomyces sp. M41 TaxID=3059412 RepID=UPI00374CBB65
MTPVELSRTVLCAVRRAVDDGELRVTVPERAVVTAPGPGGCGDYATNIALQLARPAGQPPRQVAEILKARLAGSDGVRDVVVTGPGFLNISLSETAPTALVAEILRRGPRYGFADGPTGQLVQLHCPHEIRAVVVMEAVARLLRAQGALVRTSCEARPEAEWEAALGVHVDASGQPGVSGGAAPLDVNVRPVPAPADPVPLGRDAARWALLHPAAHDRPRISDDHLVQRESNPLFRVRYAYARTRALSRNAADLGFSAEPGDMRPEAVTALPGGLGPEAVTPLPGGLRPEAVTPPPKEPRPGAVTPPPKNPRPEARTPLPDHPLDAAAPAPAAAHGPADLGFDAGPGDVRPEAVTPLPRVPPHGSPTPPHGSPTPPWQEVVTLLADHPRVLAQAAAHRAPDRLARHLVSVADAVLPVLSGVLPSGGEKPSAAHRARLALAEAVGTVLAGGLSLLGIDAPDHL